MGLKSRRWDGEPETEADTWFFDLRESGYNGPITRDGHPDTSGEDARTLRDMAAVRGEDTDWWTGQMPDQGPGSRPRMLLAALVLVVVVMVVITSVSHLRGW
jgi:hypothetical protein